MQRSTPLRTGPIFLSLVVLLATLGVGYGLWSSNLTIRDEIATGAVGGDFTAAFTDDDGKVDDPAFDSQDTGDCPIQTGGDSSCDPAASGPDPKDHWDKDVARCEANVVAPTVGKIAKRNVYPGYFCTSWFGVTNTGSIPVRIARATVNGVPVVPAIPTPVDLNDDGRDDVAIHLTGIDLCQQIDPDQTIFMDVDQEILQGAPQETTLTALIQISLQQWNEDCDGVKELVAERLAGDVLRLHTFEVDPALVDRLVELDLGNEAEIEFVSAAAGGDYFEVATVARRIEIRPDLFRAVQKIQRPNDLVAFVDVALPQEQSFLLGGLACDPTADPQDVPPRCGVLNVLNVEDRLISGMMWDPKLGFSFVEPVDMILGTPGQHPGLHIAYNSMDTVNPFTDDEEPGGDVVRDLVLEPISLNGTGSWTANIVLDGDQTFYAADPATVWTRMDAIFNNVWFIYRIIEPLSYDWSLDLDIKGMEVWVSGGPTTTDKVALTNELTDPAYFLIHPVTDQEIHLFFTGYGVSGVYGRAAGIGSGSSSSFGGGSGLNHAYSAALTTQSLKTKWVVMAHEVGHLIGGTHGSGTLTGCAGGLFSSMCGPSLMPAGAAGAPDTRLPFFSDANDAQIESTLTAVLGP